METSAELHECVIRFNSGNESQRKVALDNLLKMDLPSILQNRSMALKVLKTWYAEEKFAIKVISSSILSSLITTYREWADDDVYKHFLELLLFTQTTLETPLNDNGALVVGLASELICSESVGLGDAAGVWEKNTKSAGDIKQEERVR